jgi:formylglycine-generating enzyme required for sulfatase activity
MDMVTVGNPGNADDATGYGSVAYDYRIGKYEVTNGQYCEFLNSIAAADPYGLYNTSMGSTIYGGIERTGSTGSYFYSVKPGYSNKPVNYVCWYDAIRFVNWLNNGQGSTSTESGTYTIIDGGVNSGTASSRNASSQVWLTSENEWYKAAYYKAGGTNAGYWEYATQSDTVPNNNWPANDTGNSANYDHYGNPPYITDVGAYTFSGSAYGTFDQNGNVWEWNEAFRLGPYGPLRGIRGGSWGGADTFLPASWRVLGLEPVAENVNGGFRVASVSEPSTPPVADADGPYVIYVGDTLTLDAGGSTDDDNDIVSYVWDLDDNNSFETDAGGQAVFDVNYAYLESLGLLADNTYAIHLKVTDSESQSDIADSTLTIIPLPVIEAAVDINPNTLNLKSKGRWIMCHIWLPEGYDVTDVNSYSVTLEDEIEADWIWFDQDQQVVMAKFSRPALQQILLDLETPTDVELLVSGRLNDGTFFEGTDTIKLIEKTTRSRQRRSGKLATLRKF